MEEAHIRISLGTICPLAEASLHFGVDGLGADAIAVDWFIAPLAVVDKGSRGSSDPDAQGLIDDLATWEEMHGPLPAGAFVALNSGCDARASDPAAYLNVPASRRPVRMLSLV